MRKLLRIALFLLLTVRVMAQYPAARLEINEFSQGTSGNKEFIELLVAGSKTCPDSTMDISHWIIDDQNGWFAQGAGSAISGGHYRFRNITAWKKIPIGALIVIYNDADRNTNSNFPADDPTDANHDDVYVVPVSSPLLEYSTLPANGTGTPMDYSLAAYTQGSGVAAPQHWLRIGQRDIGDVVIAISPGGNYSQPAGFCAIGYAVTPFFSGPAFPTVNKVSPASGAGLSYYFNNEDGDHEAAGSWGIGNAGTITETPGKPNSLQNESWINKIRQHPLRTMDIRVSPSQPLVCSGSGLTLKATNAWSAKGIGTWNWNWWPAEGLSAGSGENVVANPAFTTTYRVAGKDTAQCEDTAYVTVEVIPAPGVAGIQQFCNNTRPTVAELRPYGPGYLWFDNATTTDTLSSASPLVAGTYFVSRTENGCESARVKVIVQFNTVAMPSVTTIQPRCVSQTGVITIITPSGPGMQFSINGRDYVANNRFSGVQPGTYNVTVKDSAGCISLPTTTIISPATPGLKAMVSAKPANCQQNGAITITALDGTPPYQYSINSQPFQQSPVFTGLQQGAYAVTVKDALGCTALNQSSIAQVNDFALQVYATPNPVVPGSQVLLQSQATTPYEILTWLPASMFPNTLQKRQYVTADTNVRIGVIAKTRLGCLDTAYVMVIVDQFDDVFVPTAFTPNNDGKNDVLNIRGLKDAFEWKIINRFGQVVFVTTDRSQGWDGKVQGVMQPAGVYIYQLRVIKTDGSTVLKKGTITLMR